MTVSPLYFMAHNPELALFSTGDEPMGLALDPSTHLRQLPRERRAAAFRALPFGDDSQAFDPDHDGISDAQFAALATVPLELERVRGATLMLNAFHLTGAMGSRGRELDLRLAQAAIAHFRQQRMDEPPEQAIVGVRREIFATLAVRREVLRSPHELRRLADAYLALDADGFWAKIERFDERAPRADIRAAGRLLAMLGEDERAVVSCGPGQLHLGLLVNDISTSVGLAESERFRFPAHREKAEWRRGGRSRTAYHPRYLRSFAVGGQGAARAFQGSPCRCGAHGDGQPPNGPQVDEHAAIVRAVEAREALAGETVERREWLLATAAMASHLAHDVGVDFTPSVVYEALFDGIDGADEQLELAG
jgi:hypothetical protein